MLQAEIPLGPGGAWGLPPEHALDLGLDSFLLLQWVLARPHAHRLARWDETHFICTYFSTVYIYIYTYELKKISKLI